MKRLFNLEFTAILFMFAAIGNPLNAHYCPKCVKIESERIEEQSKKDYKKNDYYENYLKNSSNDNSSKSDSHDKDLGEKNQETSSNIGGNKENFSFNLEAASYWLAAVTTENSPSIKADQSLSRKEPLGKDPNLTAKLSNPANSSHAESTIADILTIRSFMDVFENSFTLLVPSDEAIKNFPSIGFNKILDPENRELLFGYITNHIIPRQILRQDFNKAFKTLGGRIVEIESGEQGLTVNKDAKVLKSFPLGNNGILYVIDRVLIPIHD